MTVSDFEEITRSDAGAKNLTETITCLEKIIEEVTEGGKTSVGSSYSIAKTYAVLKRKEETLKWLEYAYEVPNRGAFTGGLFTISEDEEFDWLRSDPRFQDLVKRLASARVGGPVQRDQK